MVGPTRIVWANLTPFALQSNIVDDYAAELSELSALHWDADDEARLGRDHIVVSETGVPNMFVNLV
jgi:hypothetical protein